MQGAGVECLALPATDANGVAAYDDREMLRFLTAGESHGRALLVIIEGLPAGLTVTVESIQGELGRRRLGYGRGPRMRFEADEVTLVSGVLHGQTIGSPVGIQIENSEWARWEELMSPAPGGQGRILTQPRPGHADLAGMQKYGFEDVAPVLERASARETAARVAAGSCCKAVLATIGIDVVSHVVQLGPAVTKSERRPTPADLVAVDGSPVRCFDPEAEEAMVAEVKAAMRDGDSLGGAAEILAYGVPVGLGSHVHWDRKIDGLLMQAIGSIQAVKAVEVGEGVDAAGRRGSAAHDPITVDATGAYGRSSDLAGGVEGGITTGGLVWARAYMKPLATLARPVLETVDVKTKQVTTSFKERTDATAVPAMGVVAETMMAFVLAREALRKFGGDSVAELVRNRDAFVDNLA